MIIKKYTVSKESFHRLSIYGTLIAIFVFSGFSFSKNKIKDPKGRIFHMSKIGQVYSNPQLNSFFPFDVISNGKVIKKFKMPLLNNGPVKPWYLLSLTESKIIIDTYDAAILFDISSGMMESVRAKSFNSFITVSEENIYLIDGTLNIIKPTQFSDSDLTGFFIPGGGEYWKITAFMPFEEFFIVATQSMGIPPNPYPQLYLVCRGYPGSRSRWEKNFSGVFLTPPITSDGTIFLFSSKINLLVDSAGKENILLRDDVKPIVSSIGIDETIYIVLQKENTTLLRAISKNGKVLWEVTVNESDFVQPPICSKTGYVLLVSSSSIECFLDGVSKWSFSREGISTLPFFVSCTRNDRLIVIDGTDMVCLDLNGDQLWKATPDSNENFITQPIVDSKGKIICATDNSIVIVE